MSEPAKPVGRPGLQRSDVAEAIDALTKAGHRDPSLSQIRQHLGRGSNGTISRLRSEIRAERMMATRTPVEGSIEAGVLPVLLKAMEQLGQEAASAADDQIAQMRNDFEAAQIKMTGERDKAAAERHDMQIELATRKDQVTDLQGNTKALRAEIADEKKRLERALKDRDKLTDQTHDLQTDVGRLEAEHDRVEATLREKTSALQEAESAKERLRQEHDDLRQQNTTLESQLREEHSRGETARHQVEELEAEHTTLSERGAAAEARVQELEKALAASKAGTKAEIEGLNARLADALGTIEALIGKVGSPE